MKKYLSLISVLLFSFVLLSCKADNEEEPVDEFELFKEIVTLYSANLRNGFDYSARQTLETTIVHDKTIEQRISREPEIKIYTETYELFLQEFSIEDAFYESITTTYFYQDEVGTQIDDGEVTWEDMSLENYLSTSFRIGDITKDDFISFDIETLEHTQILSGELKASAIQRLFKADISVIEDSEISIKIDVEEELLLEFQFVYTSEETKTEILFQPYYGVANVVLPQQ